MKPRVTIVTLGVSDLARAVDFYQAGLSLPRHPFEGDTIAFFDLDGGRQLLALFPRDELAKDVGMDAASRGFSGITLAHNVDSREGVETVMAEAEAAGATILKPAQKPPWGGWSGYFADLDGHIWEVAYQPNLSFGD